MNHLYFPSESDFLMAFPLNECPLLDKPKGSIIILSGKSFVSLEKNRLHYIPLLNQDLLLLNLYDSLTMSESQLFTGTVTVS